MNEQQKNYREEWRRILMTSPYYYPLRKCIYYCYENKPITKENRELTDKEAIFHNMIQRWLEYNGYGLASAAMKYTMTKDYIDDPDEYLIDKISIDKIMNDMKMKGNKKVIRRMIDEEENGLKYTDEKEFVYKNPYLIEKPIRNITSVKGPLKITPIKTAQIINESESETSDESSRSTATTETSGSSIEDIKPSTWGPSKIGLVTDGTTGTETMNKQLEVNIVHPLGRSKKEEEGIGEGRGGGGRPIIYEIDGDDYKPMKSQIPVMKKKEEEVVIKVETPEKKEIKVEVDTVKDEGKKVFVNNQKPSVLKKEFWENSALFGDAGGGRKVDGHEEEMRRKKEKEMEDRRRMEKEEEDRKKMEQEEMKRKKEKDEMEKKEREEREAAEKLKQQQEPKKSRLSFLYDKTEEEEEEAPSTSSGFPMPITKKPNISLIKQQNSEINSFLESDEENEEKKEIKEKDIELGDISGGESIDELDDFDTGLLSSGGSDFSF